MLFCCAAEPGCATAPKACLLDACNHCTATQQSKTVSSLPAKFSALLAVWWGGGLAPACTKACSVSVGWQHIEIPFV